MQRPVRFLVRLPSAGDGRGLRQDKNKTHPRRRERLCRDFRPLASPRHYFTGEEARAVQTKKGVARCLQVVPLILYSQINFEN